MPARHLHGGADLQAGTHFNESELYGAVAHDLQYQCAFKLQA